MISSTSKEFTFNSENSASFYLFEKTFHYGESYVRSFYLFFRIHGALVLNQQKELHNALIMRTSPGFRGPRATGRRGGGEGAGLEVWDHAGDRQAEGMRWRVRGAGLRRGKHGTEKNLT